MPAIGVSSGLGTFSKICLMGFPHTVRNDLTWNNPACYIVSISQPKTDKAIKQPWANDSFVHPIQRPVPISASSLDLNIAQGVSMCILDDNINLSSIWSGCCRMEAT